MIGFFGGGGKSDDACSSFLTDFLTWVNSMKDVMEYLEQFNSVLAAAVCEIDGTPDFLALIQIESLYDRDKKIQAAMTGNMLGYPAEEAAVVFAVYEEMRVGKGTGMLSKLLSGSVRDRISKLQKIRNLLFPYYQNIPVEKVKKYLLLLSKMD